MHTRRATLGALATAGVAALAGCSLLEDALEQEAEPAAVEDNTVGSSDFEQDSLADQVYEESIEIAGESRDLRLTNWTNQYTRTVSGVDFDAARFSLFTTPTVTVAGESANPFGRFDREQLLQDMIDRFDVVPIQNIERTGERTVMMFDEALTVGEFDAETDGGVQLRLHLADRTHDGDLLVLFGLHPELLDTTGELDTLAQNVVHPADRP